MGDATKLRLPWLLVFASLVLAALLAYTLFVGYLPAKQRIVGLERELKDVYAREADVDTRHAQRDGQLQALMAERDALAQRVAELQRELAVIKNRRPPP